MALFEFLGFWGGFFLLMNGNNGSEASGEENKLDSIKKKINSREIGFWDFCGCFFWDLSANFWDFWVSSFVRDGFSGFLRLFEMGFTGDDE